MRFAQDNDMVDALASDRSDQSFGEAVLPRRARGDGLVTDAHGAQSAGDECAAHPIPITDQLARKRAQIRGNLRSASKRAGFPTPVPTEAGPMPTHEGFGADDRDGLEDRWKPSIQLNQEQAITIRVPDATAHLRCSTIS